MAKHVKRVKISDKECPRCGGHLAKESGFWRCQNKSCQHTMFYGQSLPNAQKYSPVLPSQAFEGQYSHYKGQWQKVVGTTKGVDEELS